jgi:hypothetical protein
MMSLNYQLILLFLINLISIGPHFYLFINNIYLAICNVTIMEQNSPPRVQLKYFKNTLTDNVFDLGDSLLNLKQIFNSNILLAFLPCWTTPGNGHNFKTI